MSDTLTNRENVTSSAGHGDAITASPRPWRFRTSGTLDPVTQVVDADGRPISDRAHIRANLALIVEAVNERAALSDLVRRLADRLELYHIVGKPDHALICEAKKTLGGAKCR